MPFCSIVFARLFEEINIDKIAKLKLLVFQVTHVYGLVQNVSTLKYCSPLEICFLHFREDLENFIVELCFFTTKYAL